MTKIIHCADLHLAKAEADYCLSVFDNILQVALKKKAVFLLLAGDIFDTFADADAMQHDFRSAIKKLEGTCEVFYIAGNHEEHLRNRRQLRNLDLGIPAANIFEGNTPHFTLINRGEVEFLAIPHRDKYSDYREWGVPAKAPGRRRIAIAHGMVAQMYSSLRRLQAREEEEPSAVLDVDLFIRFETDYAAMGHIHAANSESFGPLQIVYPGSARVWRKSELGPRSVVLLEIDNDIRRSTVALTMAGQCRYYNVFAGFDGRIEMPPDAVWQREDMIEIEVAGLVENAETLRTEMESLVKKYDGAVRKFAIENRTNVVAGLSSHPVAAKFLEAWKKRKPDPETPEALALWNQAREIGLSQIQQLVGRQA